MNEVISRPYGFRMEVAWRCLCQKQACRCDRESKDGERDVYSACLCMDTFRGPCTARPACCADFRARREARRAIYSEYRGPHPTLERARRGLAKNSSKSNSGSNGGGGGGTAELSATVPGISVETEHDTVLVRGFVPCWAGVGWTGSECFIVGQVTQAGSGAHAAAGLLSPFVAARCMLAPTCLNPLPAPPFLCAVRRHGALGTR